MLAKLKDWMLSTTEVNTFDWWLYRTVIYLYIITLLLEFILGLF